MTATIKTPSAKALRLFAEILKRAKQFEQFLAGPRVITVDREGNLLERPYTISTPCPNGVYVTSDGEIVRVKMGQQSSQPYAFVWNNGWEYAGRKPFPRIVRQISAAEAAEFGHNHDHCVYCTKSLTDKRSTEHGYGPICAERYDLPWGEK